MRILLLGPIGRNERIKGFLETLGHSVHITAAPLDREELSGGGVDFLISNGYAPIIPPSIVSLYRDRILNVHGTMLPWGKGIGAVVFGLLEGAPIGVTLHFIDEGIDTGDVLAQRRVPYSSDETLRQLYARLLAEAETLFFETWDSIEHGRCQRTRQELLGTGSPYRNRVDSERFLDLLPLRWDTPIAHLECMAGDYALSEDFWGRYETEGNQGAK